MLRASFPRGRKGIMGVDIRSLDICGKSILKQVRCTGRQEKGETDGSAENELEQEMVLQEMLSFITLVPPNEIASHCKHLFD